MTSLMNKSVNAEHAFDLDATTEPIPDDDASDYDAGYDAMADGNDHGEFSLIIFFHKFIQCKIHCNGGLNRYIHTL